MRALCLARLGGRLVIGGCLVGGLLAIGCQRGEETEEPIRVWFDGCGSVRRGAVVEAPWVCAREPAKPLRLWIPESVEADLQVFLDGRPVAAEVEKEPEGARVVLDGLDDGRLELRAGHRPSRVVWALGYVPPPQEPTALQRARELAATDLDHAFEEAEAGWEAASDPTLRARYRLFQARLGQKAGRFDQADRHYREARDLFAASGRVSEQIVAGVLLFRLSYYDREDHAAAEQALAELPRPPPGDLDSAYRTHFYPAVWAVRTGRFRAAAGHLDAALRHARRAGDEGREIFLQQMRAPLYSRFGRYLEAVSLLTPFEETEVLGPCHLGQLIQNVAWNQLLAWEAWGGPDRARQLGLEEVAAYTPIPRLERALEILSTAACDEDEKTNIRLNLALAHFHRGQITEAEAQLQAVSGEAKAWHEVWTLDLQGRLALVGGNGGAALHEYQRLEALGRRLHSPDARWRALVGQGRALRAMGRGRDALETYAAAEDLVDAEMLAVPVGAEQETSLQARAAGTRELLELLLEAGLGERALELARRSHSRAFRALFETHHIADLDPRQLRRWAEISRQLRQLDEEEALDWTISGERWEAALEDRRQRRQALLDRVHLLLGGDRFAGHPLPELSSDEATLVFHPLPQGWAGFAVRGERLEIHRIDRPDTRWLGDAELAASLLLAPFADLLLGEGVARVRILAPGALSGIDFHALPLRGAPLLATKTVVYGLDLGAPSREGSAGAAGLSGAGHLLLVVDPRRDLQGASAEGDAVVAALGQRFGTRRLDHEAATLDAVLGELGDASLLHFAGHADFSGRGGWDSGLALAADTRLTVPSLLSLPSVPPTVVLSACESGASSDGPSEGLGLARAFVLAGAREVVGAVRPVADATSRRMAEELYRFWTGDEAIAHALRRAQLTLAADGGVEDWQAFRAVER